MKNIKNRVEYIVEQLKKLNCFIETSVTRKTDYVIVGNNPGSQADKAGNLGIRIRTEEEFE